jgi:hypothetical protein
MIKLKSTLLSKPVLITPSFDLPFIGQTDAGNKSIRAVLSQDISDVEHPIARIICLEMVIQDIKVVCNGLVNHSSQNNTHRSLTVILTEPWHRRSGENSYFQNGKLFNFSIGCLFYQLCQCLRETRLSSQSKQ